MTTIHIQQAMSKYVSRFALGLSTSVPGIFFPAEKVHYLPDIGMFFEAVFWMVC